MSGYTNQEPVDKYIEKVRVGRRFVQEHDVILSYINPGVGRGDFQVSPGTISEVPSSSGRRLTIEYYIGNDFKSFEITRNQGGGYTLHSPGYWKEELGCNP